MPQIVDYSIVAQRLTSQGLVHLYHNAGAFGFAPGVKVHTLGWMGPLDPTIRPEMQDLIQQVREPYHERLAWLLVAGWWTHIGGEVWLMPKSHWHYELHFGNRALLERLLPTIGIEPKLLADRNDGSAIAFPPAEVKTFETFLPELMCELHNSDFLLAFPGRAVLCTIHHHQQLWWQTTIADLVNDLRAMVTESRKV